MPLPVQFSSQVPRTVTINSFFVNQLFQRSAGTTSKTITFSGSYTGGPSLTGTVNKVSDNSVVANLGSFNLSGGVWTATASVPQGGPYYAKVSTGTSTSQSGNWQGVGVIVMLYGQSNMSVLSTAVNSAPSANAGTSYYDYGSALWTSVPNANGVRQLLNNMNSTFGVPVAAFNISQNGADADYLAGNWAAGGGWSLYAVPTLTAVGNDIEFMFWNQGETNTSSAGGQNSPNQTEDKWAADMELMQSNLITITGRSSSQIPIILSSLGSIKGPSLPAGEFWAEQQKLIYDVGTQVSNMTYSHTDIFATLGADGLHLNGSDTDKVGKMFAQTAAVVAGLTSGYPNWFITSASIGSSTTTTIGLTHSLGTDFTPTSGITGFEVSGDGGATWITPSAASRTNATTVGLTHSALGTAHRLVRYCWGPVTSTTNIIIDNSSIGVPLNYTPDWITCASPTIPVPTFQVPGSFNTFNSGTNICTSNANHCIGDGSAQVLAIVAVSQQGTQPTSITLTPYPNGVLAPGSAGTPVSLSKVAFVSGGGCTIWTGTVPSGNKSCSISAQYPGNPFSGIWFDVFTVPTSLLNSTSPVATAGATMTAGDSTHSVTLATSANGFVIACALQNDIEATFSGTEVYAKAHHVPLSNVASAWSAVNSANASSTVTITMGTVATSQSNMLAASFR